MVVLWFSYGFPIQFGPETCLDGGDGEFQPTFKSITDGVVRKVIRSLDQDIIGPLWLLAIFGADSITVHISYIYIHGGFLKW